MTDRESLECQGLSLTPWGKMQTVKMSTPGRGGRTVIIKPSFSAGQLASTFSVGVGSRKILSGPVGIWMIYFGGSCGTAAAMDVGSVGLDTGLRDESDLLPGLLRNPRFILSDFDA
jgi:hypothetical protein